MAEVTVEIGGRDYRLGCAEGEEAQLLAYAQKMNGIAEAIKRRVGTSVTETRLLVMVGMTLADELAEAEGRTRAAKKEAAKAKDLADSRTAPNDMFHDEVEERIADRINGIATRIEELAERLD